MLRAGRAEIRQAVAEAKWKVSAARRGLRGGASKRRMGDFEKEPFAFVHDGAPHVISFVAANAELIREQTDHRLDGDAVRREVDTLERRVRWEAVLGEGPPDLEVSRRVWVRRSAQVVVAEDPAVSLDVLLVLIACLVDLQPVPFLGGRNIQFHVQTQIAAVPQRQGIARPLPSREHSTLHRPAPPRKTDAASLP